MGLWAHSLLGLSQWDGKLVSTPLCLSGAKAEPVSLKPCLSLLLKEAMGQAQMEGRAARKWHSQKRQARGRETWCGPRQQVWLREGP